MKINLHVFLFYIIAVIASINDILIYTTPLEYSYISLSISAIMVFFINIFLIKKKIIIVKFDFDLYDLIFLTSLILLYLIFSNIADVSFDTVNYHIYLQENCFADKINFDFFTGRTINGFLFPLGDRMHYICRYILGYKLGTILSYYCLCILYYQMKELLKTCVPKISKVTLCIFSMMPTFCYFVNDFLGSYYIDCFSYVLLLELIILFVKKIDLFEEKKYLYYITFVLGLATGVKLPNLILGAVIVIAIILRNIVKDKKIIINEKIKKVKIKDFLICFILLIFPFIIYAIDNYIQTGSPIYPYYNKVFKSEYFPEINWQDPNFGVPNVLYSFIWPVSVVIEPDLGNDLNKSEFIFAVGYIIAILYIIIKLKNKKNNTKNNDSNNKNNIILELSILSTCLSITWANFLMGYVRYAIILPILYVFIIELIILELIEKIKEKKYVKINRLLVVFLSILLIIMISNQVSERYTKLENSIALSKYPIIDDGKGYTILKEDKEDIVYEIEDGVWATIDNCSSPAVLLRNPNVPIYNLDTQWFLEDETLMKLRDEKIKDKVFYIAANKKLLWIKTILERRGFEIIDTPIKYINPKYQNVAEPWYIVKVKYVK